MSKSFPEIVRSRAKNSLYRFLTSHILYKNEEKDLEKYAFVFAPHPDDEILGCGGTIIRKKRAAADINIFFMTNGEAINSHLISQKRMGQIRVKECLAACRVLGLKKSDLIFLGLKDGELKKNENSAIHKIIEILQHQQPEEIFIPYKKEFHPDHFATNKIVKSALQIYNREVTLYEYPIWFWCHWPWVSRAYAQIASILKLSLTSSFNLLKDFRCSVYIGDVLEHKRSALDQYKSQMTKLIADPSWWTLSDVANGEFLECFFQEYEFFHRARVHRSKTPSDD